MKIPKAAVMFACGLLLGVTLTFCLGAADNAPAPAPQTDHSKLQVVAFSSGVLGIFDPGTGRLYLYDDALERCYSIRELKTLGAPLVHIR